MGAIMDYSNKENINLEDPREIVAEVYRQITQLRERGIIPEKVFLHKKLHESVIWYRNFLGSSESSVPDYLGDYELFGIPVYAASEPNSVTVV
jgi:hypothetical protein